MGKLDRQARSIEISLDSVGDVYVGKTWSAWRAVAELHATIAHIESCERRGYQLQYIKRSDRGYPRLVMVKPLPMQVVEELRRKLDQNIKMYDFHSPRVHKALQAAGITTYRQLVSRTEHDLLFSDQRVKGLGGAGLAAIRDQLDEMDLKLGMSPAELEGKKARTKK